MTDELLNLEPIPIQSAAAKKLAKADAIASKRYRQRGERKQELAETAFRRSALGKLTRVWSDNFAALPPEEQSRINAEHTLAVGFLWDIEDTIRGIQQNKIAGETMLHPDILWMELQQFLKQLPGISRWAPPETAAQLDKDDFDLLADTAFRDTGFVTRVPFFMVKHYGYWCWQWAQTHKEECDESVFTELSAIFAKPERPPISQPVGYSPMTRAEERGLMAHKENLEQLRRKAVFDRIGDNHAAA